MYRRIVLGHRHGLVTSGVIGDLRFLWMNNVERWRPPEAHTPLSLGINSIEYAMSAIGNSACTLDTPYGSSGKQGCSSSSGKYS